MPTVAEKIKTISELRKQAETKVTKDRDAFITGRAQHEQIIEAMAEAVKDLPADMRKKLNVPAEVSCELMFPSLYKDKFVMEDYTAERAEYEELRQRFLAELDGLATLTLERLEKFLASDNE